jgi:hypothetical protein
MRAWTTFVGVTVTPPGQPDHQLILLEPGPPTVDQETAEQIKALVAKGALGTGAFETDDCRATYAQLRARGVNFLSGPTERHYGIEALMRDNSGNWFSLTERTDPGESTAPTDAGT